MKNKAFTLVELLAVIVIISLLSAIIAPKVLDMISDSENTLQEQQINKILEATRKYVIENTDLLPEEKEGKQTIINVETLLEQGIIENDIIINPKTKEKLEGYVLITYSENYNQFIYEFVE